MENSEKTPAWGERLVKSFQEINQLFDEVKAEGQDTQDPEYNSSREGAEHQETLKEEDIKVIMDVIMPDKLEDQPKYKESMSPILKEVVNNIM